MGYGVHWYDRSHIYRNSVKGLKCCTTVPESFWECQLAILWAHWELSEHSEWGWNVSFFFASQHWSGRQSSMLAIDDEELDVAQISFTDILNNFYIVFIRWTSSWCFDFTAVHSFFSRTFSHHLMVWQKHQLKSVLCCFMPPDVFTPFGQSLSNTYFLGLRTDSSSSLVTEPPLKSCKVWDGKPLTTCSGRNKASHSLMVVDRERLTQFRLIMCDLCKYHPNARKHWHGPRSGWMFLENVSMPLGLFFPLETVGPFTFRCQAPHGPGL